MDNELFELCKSVYEKTGWEDTSSYFVGERHYKTNEISYEIYPAYEDAASEGYRFDYKNKLLCYESGYDYETNEDGVDGYSPLYTSDYILEKLPRGNDLFDEPCILAVTQHSNGQWLASYLPFTAQDPMNPKIAEYADTPLKALLQLTLALHEAGELPTPRKEDK